MTGSLKKYSYLFNYDGIYLKDIEIIENEQKIEDIFKLKIEALNNLKSSGANKDGLRMVFNEFDLILFKKLEKKLRKSVS